MPDNTDTILKKLDQLISNGEAHCYFNPPADPADIESLEERNGFRLPESYRLFLNKFNGGMIVSDSLEKIIQRDGDLETAKWNANNLLGVGEIETAYQSMKDRSYAIAEKFGPTYPFIPFFNTMINEYLVFVNVSDNQPESPVFDAYHEEPAELWGEVAVDFNEFFLKYIDTIGDPEIIGDEGKGVAANLVDPIEEEEKEKSSETLEEIIERTTATMKEDPTDDWAFVERGMTHKSLGNFKAALEDFNKGIELAGEMAFNHFARGSLFQAMKKIKAALIDYDVAVKLEPNDAFYLCCRADMLYEMKKIEKALEDVNRAIELEENYIVAYMTREQIYRTLGEVEKAEKDARKITELHNNE